ncbi:MAG: RNase P subunit p30 family protein [Candidatus Kariarchaeaceae archaeon]
MKGGVIISFDVCLDKNLFEKNKPDSIIHLLQFFEMEYAAINGYSINKINKINNLYLEEIDEGNTLERKALHIFPTLVSRITIKEKNDRELKNKVRNYRNDYHIIAVEPTSENQARWAARDGRVDIVTCNNHSVTIMQQESIFSLAKAHSKVIEFQMRPIITAMKSTQGKLVRQYSKVYSYIKQRNVIFCISSGAEESHHLKEMDTWRTLATIFGVEYSKEKEAISTSCLDIYLRNVERLKPGYIGEGMFIEVGEEE